MGTYLLMIQIQSKMCVASFIERGEMRDGSDVEVTLTFLF